jgi:preprotein translocase subunit SecB
MNKNKKPNSEKYREFIKTIELRDIKLIELNTHIIEEQPTTDNVLKVDIKTTNEHKIFNNILIFYVNYILTMKQSKKVVLKIKAIYKVDYELLKRIEIDEKTIDSFSEMNLPLNVWPFFRELCNDITAKMRIPSLVLPLLKR